ncbi:GroES-like protein [Necator americanus]|uniref:GroES-like protein n=1 Tax=Necator americanus TaxID=51031 RepID=W2T0M8_NECAM|nr:GroES-like protein [Necator americanus]ETN75119.1 GroES-like protein [Necator americanus]
MPYSALKRSDFALESAFLAALFPASPWMSLPWTGDFQVHDEQMVLGSDMAASVNPVDTFMVKGYGNDILGTWKQVAERNLNASRYPLIAGRDCAGVVEMVGGGVKSFRPGDEVMAVVPAIWQGSHAEYVVTEEPCCAHKPSNLDFSQAAALPYVANTAWAALVSVARMNPRKPPEERVLIHGGSGGLGTMAIQMLKAWGVLLSADAVRKLGAIPVDYRATDVCDQLIAEGPFEVILDCVDTELARWSDTVMGVWRNSVHVSVVSPMMRDTDRYGLLLGLGSTAVKHFCRSYKSALRGRWYSYAFFVPSEECMKQLSAFAMDGKIVPIVERVLSFEELPSAYEKVSQLHGRGKTVLTW